MPLRSLLVALALASALPAQCGTNTIAFNQYGSGCSGFGQTPPMLTGFYLHNTCQVTLTISSTPENCPTLCLVEHVVAVGVIPIQVPLGLVPCDLLVEPVFTMSLSAGAGYDFVVTLPPISLIGLQVYVQGGNIFSTPTGYAYEVTNGLHLDYL
jgi:hypothetical protein